MNVFILGLRVTATAAEDEGTVNVLAESLPSNEKRVATKVQLIQKADHYVGKLLKKFEEGQTVLALGPTRPTPDGVLQMQPMLVVTEENFQDLLAINLFIATGGLGPKADEMEIGDNTVTNRSLAWQTEDQETAWMKLSAWGELNSQNLLPVRPPSASAKFQPLKRTTSLTSTTIWIRFFTYPKRHVKHLLRLPILKKVK